MKRVIDFIGRMVSKLESRDVVGEMVWVFVWVEADG